MIKCKSSLLERVRTCSRESLGLDAAQEVTVSLPCAEETNHADPVLAMLPTVDFWAAQGNEESSLYRASATDHPDTINFLLPDPAVVDKQPAANGQGMPLFTAVQEGTVEGVKALLAGGAPVEHLDQDERTPLHCAAQHGHLEVALALLAAGAKVDPTDYHGATPTLIAAQEGHLEVVEALLNAGAWVDQPMNNGSTPLYWASANGHLEVVKVLLAAGALVENIRRTLPQYNIAQEFLQPLVGQDAPGRKRRSSVVVRVTPNRRMLIEDDTAAQSIEADDPDAGQQASTTYTSQEMRSILKHHIQMPGVVKYVSPRRSDNTGSRRKVPLLRTVGDFLAKKWSSTRRWINTHASLVKRDPRVIAAPLILCAVLCAVGIWAVLSAAQTENDYRVKFAVDTAASAARELTNALDASFAPMAAMSTILDKDANYTRTQRTFPFVAEALLKRLVPSGSIGALTLLPAGVIRDIYPLQDNAAAVGLDMFSASARRGFALLSAASRSIVMSGPYSLVQGGTGGVVFYPMFVTNMTEAQRGPFNNTPTRCDPGTICTPDFWGFVTALYRWETVLNTSRLADLARVGLDYSLTQPNTFSSGNSVVFNQSDIKTLAGTVGLSKAVSVAINLPNLAAWTLSVEDQRGWDPVWKWPVLAAVVVISLVISVLMYEVMASGRKHQWLLEAMMPPKVIRHLHHHDTFTESFENVTILFSDIVSYTTMVSDLEPGSVVKLLNELYSVYDALTDQFGLYKVETIGDAFMAVGGCPDRAADPVEAAARVAMLAQAMVECTRSLRLEGGHCIQIRIGIHSGPVEAAVVGTKMPRYCLFGDTVNTASRMESNSAAMRIHLSNATAQLLQRSPEEFRVVDRGDIDVKGKGVMRTHWLDPTTDRLPFVKKGERKSLECTTV